MADDQTIAPPAPEAPPTPDQAPPQGQPNPANKALYDQLSKGGLYTKSYEEFQQQFSKPEAIDQLYQHLNQGKLYSKSKEDFYGQFFQGQKPAQAPAAAPEPAQAPAGPPAPPPEHQLSHTPLQDIRHLNDLANQPMRMNVSSAGEGAPGVSTPYPEDVARNKGFQNQYDKVVTDQAAQWGTDPASTKRAFQDFPTVKDESVLKSYADLAKTNPVNYQRIKDGTDIRQAILSSGQPGAFTDAQEMNNLFQVGLSSTYENLQHNIAQSQELLHKYGLDQQYFEKLKNVYAPLINTLQPGLLVQHWNSPEKDIGLSDFQYAGLETEKMFNPGKYQQDMAILKHNSGLDENTPGQNTPIPVGKKGYAYDRGVENVLYALENQGRQNTGDYINQRSVNLDNQIGQLKAQYQQRIDATPDQAEKYRLQAEFNANPLLAEMDKLNEGQHSIDYARSEDQMKFPLNFGDQATRLVKDAMSPSTGVAGVVGNQVLLGAGGTSDNTARFFKNTFINLLGSEQLQAENAAVNIGHESLTQLAGYEGSAFSTQQPALVLDPKVLTMVQAIGDNPNLSQEEKNKQANQILLDHPDAVKLNPLAGHQNLTYKTVAYTAANTLGQILGIADQSLLMGGLVGDVSKAQKMANALTPMYASTQNQLYEQALARGDEHPLLSSHLDATIISLASMINPDVKVVKGMMGAETALGKTVLGIEDGTWNKVLSENKPLLDRMIAGTRATAKQLGLANLQYGLIVPTAQYVVHKNILNENPNLGDAITDGLLQTSLTMALPALLHGVWGGISATQVNPMQKGAIVEAGLHPKENIELIDQMVQKGQVTPDRAEQIKDVIRQSSHILEHTEAVKGDGSWMNEKEVQDLTYNMLRKRVLEGKLKGAPDPQKPAIEAKIAEIDKSIAELHTSKADQQKTELNNMLTSSMDRIKEKVPTMEGQVLEAIKRNEPEGIFQEIYDQASQTTKFEGRDVSTRPQAEEAFGKDLVDKAIELHNNKTENDGQANDDAQPGRRQTQAQGQVSTEKPQEGAAPQPGEPQEPAASSFLQSRHADTIHDEQGIVSGPNNKELSAKGRRDAGDLAKDVEGKGVTSVITSGLERSKETGHTVADKVGVKVESRPELNTWDIKHFDGLTDEEFKDVQRWFVENPDEITYKGPIEKYQGKQVGESINEYAGRVIPAMERIEKENGPETLLVNHSNNMMLWDAYLKNGREWNDQARQDYLHAEKPEPATLTNQTNDHAIHEPGPAALGAHAGGNTGVGGTAEGEGVGPSEQGQAPPGQTGGAREGHEPPGEVGGGPPLSEDNPFRENLDDLPNGIKKAISTSIRTELKLPEIALPKLGTDVQIVQKGKAAVDSGRINPREVVRRVTQTNGIYTPDEGAAMIYYGHQLMAAEADTRAERTEADGILKKDPDNTAAFYAKVTAEQRLGQLDDEIELKTRADRLNSRAWGNLGNVMQITTDESFSPSRVRMTVAENYGGEMPKAVEQKLEAAFAERDAAIAEMKAAKEKVALMEMEKDAQKSEPKQSRVGRMIQEKKAALKTERATLIDDLKKAIKKDSGNLGANPLPIHTIEAVSKLALNYFRDGVLTIEGITNKIYEDLKDVVEGIDKNQIREAVASYRPLAREQATEKSLKKAAKSEVDIERLDSRRKTNPDIEMEQPQKLATPIFEKDSGYIKANQRRINAEFRIKQEKMKSYSAKESRLQKTLGWANRLMRLSILSGYHVLAKLSAAAVIGSAAQKPIEEVMNGIWSKAFPKISAKSDMDMGLNLLAVGRYYSHFFNPVEFARDTRDIVKGGETQLGKELEKQHFDHIPVLDLPTDLHQVIKGPVKRAMFEYALTKILADQQSKGIDINHPLVLESARQRAFARAKYEVFMEDNSVSRTFGKWESEWKDQGKAGAAKSFLLHFAFPVSKVPTNIARRLGLSVAGLPMGLAKAAGAYRAGIENLTSEEANAIGRSLTKGSIGIALWTAGFLGYKSLGGLYSKFDPNKQRKNEPLADEMKLMGEPIAKPWQHALPFELMQMGATFRHIYEKTKTQTKSTPIAVAESTMGSTGAILEQIPVVETPVNIVTATQDPYQAKKLGEDLKRRVEPQLLVDLGVLNPNAQKPAAARPGTRGGSKR